MCNVHWESDVIEGRFVGSAAVAQLHADAAFLADLEAGKAELASVRAKGPQACAGLRCGSLSNGPRPAQRALIRYAVIPVARNVWQPIRTRPEIGGAALDHAPDIDALHRQLRHCAAMPVRGAEQGSPLGPEQARRMHVGVEIGFEIVMRRHLMDQRRGDDSWRGDAVEDFCEFRPAL